MKKLYLLGYYGYIGGKFKKYFLSKGIKYYELDRSDINYLSKILEKDDILLNCAGYTGKPNVSACENNKAECLESNVILPAKLNKVCLENGAVFANISTGCIYDGYEKNFTENDAPNFTFRQNNCSFYSGTKGLGEELIKDSPNTYLFRIRIPFDSEIDNERNYLYKLIQYPKLLNSINSISNLDEFVNCCYQIISQNHEKGIYNITNPNPIYAKETIKLLSKYSLIKEEKQWFNNHAEFLENVIVPRSNCILSTEKLKNIGLELEDTYNSLEKSIREYKKI